MANQIFSGTNSYILNDKILSNLKIRKIKPECHKCRKELQIGDLIVSKQSKNKVNIYHRKCFKDMFI